MLQLDSIQRLDLYLGGVCLPFFIFVQNYNMKLFNHIILALLLVVVSSCKKDEVDRPTFPQDYGEGMYIVTDIGVSFYNYKSPSSEVINQVFNTVNNTPINNPKKIKFKGTKAYILANNYIATANVRSFENKGSINGFMNPVDVDFVSNDRLFVVDKDDSRLKVVDLERMEIVSDIETGEDTSPGFIVSNSYKSFVLNSGGLSTEAKDSTIIVVNYRDNLVPQALLEGSLLVGDNPNSAVITSDGKLKVLCKGVFDPINSLSNTMSSLSNINQYNNEVYSTNYLSGIYNAQNLISNYNNSICYFTAEGGVYRLDPNTLNVSLITATNASVINSVVETIVINDTTTNNYEMLYMNDDASPNSLYKYNISLSSFVDTIVVSGNIMDVNFYQ